MNNTHVTKNNLIGTIVAGVILIVVFFFVGFAVGKSHAPKAGGFAYGSGHGGMNGMMQAGMRSRAGNAAAGTILSFDATSITLQTMGGGSKTILISPTTTILKSVPGTQGDLTDGTNVIVAGTPNADGSISATTISIRPAMPASASSATTAPQNP